MNHIQDTNVLHAEKPSGTQSNGTQDIVGNVMSGESPSVDVNQKISAPMTAAIDLKDQLRNRDNFVENGKLYLVRCMACGDTENYAPMIATGQCAWCGWILRS